MVWIRRYTSMLFDLLEHEAVWIGTYEFRSRYIRTHHSYHVLFHKICLHVASTNFHTLLPAFTTSQTGLTSISTAHYCCWIWTSTKPGVFSPYRLLKIFCARPCPYPHTSPSQVGRLTAAYWSQRNIIGRGCPAAWWCASQEVFKNHGDIALRDMVSRNGGHELVSRLDDDHSILL